MISIPVSAAYKPLIQSRIRFDTTTSRMVPDQKKKLLCSIWLNSKAPTTPRDSLNLIQVWLGHINV